MTKQTVSKSAVLVRAQIRAELAQHRERDDLDRRARSRLNPTCLRAALRQARRKYGLDDCNGGYARYPGAGPETGCR
jgi:hypothetical protein